MTITIITITIITSPPYTLEAFYFSNFSRKIILSSIRLRIFLWLVNRNHKNRDAADVGIDWKKNIVGGAEFMYLSFLKLYFWNSTQYSYLRWGNLNWFSKVAHRTEFPSSVANTGKQNIFPLFLKFCKQLIYMYQNASLDADCTLAGQDNFVLLLIPKFRFHVSNKSPLNHIPWHHSDAEISFVSIHFIFIFRFLLNP